MRKVEMCVLAVPNSEHDLGTTQEMMSSRLRRLPRVEAEQPGNPAPGFREKLGSAC
jgi:hypothetical protein